MWLDLANAHNLIPHELIDFAVEFFYIPASITTIIARYFSKFYMCFSASQWQQLEIGIAFGFSISLIMFAIAFEIILIRARQVVKGLKLPTGERLPALRSYVDNVTIILQTVLCTSRVLKRLDEMTAWARLKIKPSKSRSLSLE